MVEMMEWLEPSIARRVDEIIDLCDEVAKPVDGEFKAAIKYLSQRYPQLKDLLIELQDIHFNRQLIIERAYRYGFVEGVFLTKKMGLACQCQALNYPHAPHNIE